jgi:serine/threonine protein kinase/ABC-type branched-subunit amino acid transport system substrate-binding protein
MIGETIHDKYRVLDQISESHLVTNYLVKDQTLNEMIVLKLICPEIKAGSQFLDRFSAEAKKLQNLTSRQALKALDWGELETGPYAVFEYTGGKTLAQVCQTQGTLSLERVLDIAAQLGLCLVDAHDHNLMHGDLRPDHILLGADDQVKVTNFGLAWSLDLGRLIADGVIERDEYHAPELSSGTTIDGRTDLYSVGAILFEILTGHRPALMAPGHHPASLVPDLPAGIDDLVARCLAQEPDDRPQSAAEFLEGIDEIVHVMSTAPGNTALDREEVLVGHTLAAYRLMEKLGRGGMASVYKAYEPSLDRYVAIKILPRHFAHDPTFITRFRREAKAIARLNHPNIVPVFNFGKEDDLTFIVMRYVEGGTLKDLLGQPMATERVIKLVIQITRALSYAHERDVVHRDVKPANVLMAEGDWPLLSDFGLARMMGSSVQITGTGVGVGTPTYMSPEQGQGLEVDGRSDIYSLGILLYEMLTGHVPFQADTPLAVVLKHITAPLPMPRKVNPDIPESIERIILKATAKDPAHRFQAADEMIEALEKALAGEPVEAPLVSAQAPASETVIPAAPPSAVTQSPTLTPSQVSAATEVLVPPKPQRRIPVWVLGLVGALVIVGLIASTVLTGLFSLGTPIKPIPRQETDARPVEMVSSPGAATATSIPIQVARDTLTPPAVLATPTPLEPVSPAGPPPEASEVKPCEWDGLGQGLCIYPLEGGRPTRILKDAEFEFAGPASWSPDGTQIAFSALQPGGDPSYDHTLYIVDADGSNLTKLPPIHNDINPAWSPDGEWLAFHSGCDLIVTHPDGSGRTILWHAGDTACVENPQWSHDGQQIVASVRMGVGEWTFPMTREVWVFSLDSESITTVAAATYEGEDCMNFEIAFSPDGFEVAYRDDKCEAWIVPADGSGKATHLDEFPFWWTSAVHPQWYGETQGARARPAPSQATKPADESAEQADVSLLPDPWGHVVVPPGEAIRLAFVGALSGDVAEIGEVQKNGLLIALEDLPTVKGFPIDVAIIADGGCTDELLSKEAAERVVSFVGIAGVIGHTCSASCDMGAGIYEGAHLVMISPSCSAPHLSEPGREIFNRVAIRDDHGGDEYHEQVVSSVAYDTFARRYEDRYGHPLEEIGEGVFAAYAYDATTILIRAIEKVAQVDEAGNLIIGREALARAVRATADYDGVTGTISFDDNGDRLLP